MRVTTLEACERLLCEAIRGHYLGRDPLAVHLLASSAFNLARDVVRHDHPSLDPIEQVLLPDKVKRKVFWDAIRRVYNFLRHAGKGAAREIEIENLEERTESLLFHAGYDYSIAAGPSNVLVNLMMWDFTMRNSEILDYANMPENLAIKVGELSAFTLGMDIGQAIRLLITDDSFRTKALSGDSGLRYV
jgi:hypothetical protein